jgi:hypothetical protein
MRELWDLNVTAGQISASLAKAQKINEISDMHVWSIRIIVDAKRLGKFKEKDKETNLQRLIFLIDSFAKPEFMVSYTVFEADNIPFTDVETWTAIWPFQKQWVGDKDYIAVYKAESTGFDQYTAQVRGIKLDGINEYNVREYGYSDTWEDIVNCMIHSKFVVTERTTLMCLAALTGTPTILVSKPKLEMFLGNEMRPVLLGNGNLGLTYNVSHYEDNKIVQKYFTGIKNVDAGDLRNEMRNRMG